MDSRDCWSDILGEMVNPRLKVSDRGKQPGAGKMAQWLGALALPEDLGSIASIHSICDSRPSVPPVRGDQMPSSGL